MRTHLFGIARGLSSLVGLLLLAACGGGGGGGGPAPIVPVAYVGNTSPAVVTTTNASTITANVVGSADAADIIGGVSTESSNAAQNQGTGPADFAGRLSRGFRDLKKYMGPNQQAVAGVQIDDTQPCDGGNGTIRIFGPLDDMTLTGTVTVIFSNCLISEVTLNGTGQMRIEVFLTDFTMNFARLTLRGLNLSVDAGGSIRIQEFGNTETITTNLVEQNNFTVKMRQSANLMIVNVYDNISFPTSFTQTLNGQIFHSDHGYVNVSTISPFVFGTLAQLFPDSGQMLLTGALVAGSGNRTIRVTALNSTLVQLQLDTNGDSTVDNTARLKWIELTGPVGADLGDTDGDGMHNSWETFHGAPLDPLVNDAGGDADLDLETNINEYLAGTDPTP